MTVQIIADVLHDEHQFSDHRPMKGYNHCDCLRIAQRIADAVNADQFGPDPKETDHVHP